MLIDSSSIDAYLEFARTICIEAGEILVDTRRQRRLTVSTKSAFELVTDADWAVDQHIRRRVSTAFGDHTILSEEGDDLVESADAPCWIIDPLDGTANFIYGHDHVAVSAALAINNKVILGVVHAPLPPADILGRRGPRGLSRRKPDQDLASHQCPPRLDRYGLPA